MKEKNPIKIDLKTALLTIVIIELAILIACLCVIIKKDTNGPQDIKTISNVKSKDENQKLINE